METEELKRRLGQILAEEEVQPADWEAVAAMSAQLLDGAGDELPAIVKDYLVGLERRRTDAVFAHAQRSKLTLYLRA